MRQIIWNDIRSHRIVSAHGLASCRKTSIVTITKYINALHKNKYLVEEFTKDNKKYYYLHKTGSMIAPAFDKNGNPKPPSPNQRLWSAANVLKKFTPLEIALPAEVAEKTAYKFFKTMAKAQYVGEIFRRNANAPGQIGFVLRSDRFSGPLVPVILRDGSIYDQNLDRIVWQPEQEQDNG